MTTKTEAVFLFFHVVCEGCGAQWSQVEESVRGRSQCPRCGGANTTPSGVRIAHKGEGGK